MDPRRLFLERCRQMAILSESHQEVDVLDLAKILRQVFLDKKSLVDTVNARKIPLTFVATRFRNEEAMMGYIFASLEDSIDPDLAPERLAVELSRDEFCRHTAMFFRGNRISIKEIVRYAAIVAGGVHHDPAPKDEFWLVPTIHQSIGVGGLPGTIRMIKAIARVALRGLQPLIEDVAADLSRAERFP
jgi:hypothetical protein